MNLLQRRDSYKKKRHRPCFCFSSPSKWTKVIGVLDIVQRTVYIVLDVYTLTNFMINGREFGNLTNLDYVFSPDPTGHFNTHHNLIPHCVVSIVRHTIGLMVACVLLIGAINKISKLLHIWCVYTTIDTIVGWIMSILLLELTYFYIRAVQTAIIFFWACVVLTLIGEIHEEKKRRDVQICEDGPVTLVRMSIIHSPPLTPCTPNPMILGYVNGQPLVENQKWKPPPYEEFQPPGYIETVKS